MNPQAAAGRSDDGPELRIMRMLEQALAPVDPPASFVDQLESRLADVEAAALEALGELSDWELDAMRDPRNWVRPVAALAMGTAAGHSAGRARDAPQPPPPATGPARAGGAGRQHVERRRLVRAVPDPLRRHDAGAQPGTRRWADAGPSATLTPPVDERRPSSKSRRTYRRSHAL